MNRLVFAIALLAAAAMPTLAAAPDRPSPLFELRDLFSLEAASDPQISADGSRTLLQAIAERGLAALPGTTARNDTRIPLRIRRRSARTGQSVHHEGQL